ncbi:C4b-binding protein beta chain isoform X3 [Panthera pardus]|uniref:C4b-binding protein beta chain isoform X3 n=1 Tax=Panthera pardus TaxID=9691 RepID=A0A9V1EPG8_PANPR|nr:C4b-binding protein beta chain isoform X3 [Panthera pardus]
MFLRVVCYLVVVWPVSASYENCPELPPVGYSIFVAKKVEGQILGTYFCIKGYHLVGEKTFICNASGEWNTPTPTPTCQLGHCPDPVLVNGEPSFSGPVNVSDKVTFKCHENYILQGSNWSQCMNDHTWMPPLPICKSSTTWWARGTNGALMGSGAVHFQSVAFQETKDLCKAMRNFMKRLKENSLTMEEVKYFLEIQKAKLQPKNDALTL